MDDPIQSWEELGHAPKKDRELILKISGVHETSWGARSVVLGTDVSQDDWQKALEDAIDSSKTHFYIIQEFKKPKRISHPIYDTEFNAIERLNRIRLCPYYSVFEQKPHLSGVLATACPSDKKIIHGMKDAAMLPACKG